MYTNVYGPWNFGDINFCVASGENPVLFASLSKEADFFRLNEASVLDFNLDPGIIERAKALPVTTAYPIGVNFNPGGVGYPKDGGGRIFNYIQFHGGQLPPWVDPEIAKTDISVQAAIKSAKAKALAAVPKPVTPPPAPKPTTFGWASLFTSWRKK